MLHQKKLNTYIQYFFLIFFILINFPNYFFRFPAEGLDPSWNIALHLAWKQDLTFGKDVIFTYGPLGILNGRYPIFANMFAYLLFDLYFLFTLFFILKEVIQKYFGYGLIIFLFLSFVTAMYESLYNWFFLFLFFYLISFIKEPRRISFLVQAFLLSLICFYFKVSLGITAIVSFLVTISYIVIRRRMDVKVYAAVMFLYFFCIWLSSVLLNVDLKGYIICTLQLIDGYNDAMFREIGSKFRFFLYLAVIIMLILIAWTAYRIIKSVRKKEFLQNIDEFFIYGVIGLYAFVLFKSGFVRSDTHVYIFFKYISPIVGLYYLSRSTKFEKKVTAVCCWTVLAISFLSLNTIPGSFQPYKRLLNLSFFSFKAKDLKNYFNGLVEYNRALADSDKLVSKDNELKRIIGNQTVDIIPTDISTIYFNDLRYNPRPVIQSYSAYNEYLDNLNYQKYTSPEAPDYILMSVNSIDKRYPFFDESKTKLAIIKNYRIIGETKSNLILRRKEVPGKIPDPEKTDTVTVRLGEDIPVRKADDLQYSRLAISYNLLGQLQRFFYQPPPLKITFTLEGGQTQTFRAVKPILEGGVIVNKYIDSEQEFQLLMQSDGRLNANVKSIRIEGPSGVSGFIKDIKMISTRYGYEKKSDAEGIADSLSIARLIDKYKPTLSNSTDYTEEKFKYGIGYFRDYSQFIRASGWAFRENANNEKCIVKAVLKSGDNIYVLPFETRTRMDLPPVFNRDDIVKAGFVSVVSKSQLPAGEYQFGLVITDPDGKNRVNYTDHRTFIGTRYSLERMSSVDSTTLNKNNVKYAFQPFEEKGDDVLIKGWAFVKNNDSRATKTNLVLQCKTRIYRINTDIKKRMDVAESFKDTLLSYSGFSVLIPVDKLLTGVYTIGVEKVYADGKERSLVFSDKKIKIGSSDIFVPARVAELPPNQDFHSGLDFVKDEKELVHISGWAIQKMEKVQSSTIEVVLRSKESVYVSETELKARPDVTAHFHNGYYLDNSGFTAKISKKELPRGKYQVGIYIHQEGNNGTVKFTDQYIEKE